MSTFLLRILGITGKKVTVQARIVLPQELRRVVSLPIIANGKQVFQRPLLKLEPLPLSRSFLHRLSQPAGLLQQGQGGVMQTSLASSSSSLVSASSFRASNTFPDSSAGFLHAGLGGSAGASQAASGGISLSSPVINSVHDMGLTARQFVPHEKKTVVKHFMQEMTHQKIVLRKGDEFVVNLGDSRLTPSASKSFSALPTPLSLPSAPPLSPFPESSLNQIQPMGTFFPSSFSAQAPPILPHAAQSLSAEKVTHTFSLGVFRLPGRFNIGNKRVKKLIKLAGGLAVAVGGVSITAALINSQEQVKLLTLEIMRGKEQAAILYARLETLHFSNDTANNDTAKNITINKGDGRRSLTQADLLQQNKNGCTKDDLGEYLDKIDKYREAYGKKEGFVHFNRDADRDWANRAKNNEINSKEEDWTNYEARPATFKDYF